MDENQLRKSKESSAMKTEKVAVMGCSACIFSATAEGCKSHLLDFSYRKVFRIEAACGSGLNRAGIQD